MRGWVVQTVRGITMLILLAKLAFYVRLVAAVVTLISFTATPEEGIITVRWETATEIDNLGFVLYRSTEEGGDYGELGFWPSEGSGVTGHVYTYADADVQPDIIYWYKLESLDASGTSEFHGPISATLSLSATSTPSPTLSPTHTPSSTPPPTPTTTPTATPSPSPTEPPTSEPTPTRQPTPTTTPTLTLTPTPSPTATVLPTSTPTHIPSPPPTTFTPMCSSTPSMPTSTPTAESPTPPLTPTSIPSTLTPIPYLSSPTPTLTPLPSGHLTSMTVPSLTRLPVTATPMPQPSPHPPEAASLGLASLLGAALLGMLAWRVWRQGRSGGEK